VTGWTALLELVRGAFTAPGFACFTDLLTGWVATPGRRTITRILTVGDPEGRRAHDAYHRFVRAGAWSMKALWQLLATHIVAMLVPAGAVTVDCDDTLFHRDGRKVEGAGVFRDAVRSTVRKVVYARGLNLVVLTVRVRAPWGGCPLGLPVNMRLHRKGGPTTVALAAQMMTELAGWLPERNFALCADGAYASLAGAGLPRTSVTSRLRRDAALYEPAPPRTGRRGRPATKGARLPTPSKLAAAATDWIAVDVEERGRTVRRLIYSRRVLWYTVDPDQLVRLVIVRDPTGVQPDDFFVSTDTTATDGDIASRYAGRWSIEVTFRDTKQHLGGQQPQSWRGAGPERAAALSLWLHTAIWCWYLTSFGTRRSWTRRPWYPGKRHASFLDALAALRKVLWAQRITAMSAADQPSGKTLDNLLDTLAAA
jgi:hypothetical protein